MPRGGGCTGRSIVCRRSWILCASELSHLAPHREQPRLFHELSLLAPRAVISAAMFCTSELSHLAPYREQPRLFHELSRLAPRAVISAAMFRQLGAAPCMGQPQVLLCAVFRLHLLKCLLLPFGHLVTYTLGDIR
jgi:hypothetical protein